MFSEIMAKNKICLSILYKILVKINFLGVEKNTQIHFVRTESDGRFNPVCCLSFSFYFTRKMVDAFVFWPGLPGFAKC